MVVLGGGGLFLKNEVLLYSAGAPAIGCALVRTHVDFWRGANLSHRMNELPK